MFASFFLWLLAYEVLLELKVPFNATTGRGWVAGGRLTPTPAAGRASSASSRTSGPVHSMASFFPSWMHKIEEMTEMGWEGVWKQSFLPAAADDHAVHAVPLSKMFLCECQRRSLSANALHMFSIAFNQMQGGLIISLFS